VIGSKVLVALRRCPANQPIEFGSPMRRPRPAAGRQRPCGRLYGRPSAPVFALLAGLGLAAPQARAHEITKDGDPSNDWIEGLKNGNGKSCCGNNDCRPVVAGGLTASPEGGLAVEIEGNRFHVPESSIVSHSSPDGRAWICPDRRPSLGLMYRIQGVRCLLLPPLT
jgi:hypothetical protein